MQEIIINLFPGKGLNSGTKSVLSLSILPNGDANRKPRMYSGTGFKTGTNSLGTL
jgi:hypothetical protein